MTSARVRFVVFALVLATASLVVGTQVVRPRTAPPIHPITGRQIAGIATDAGWLDRRERETEEDPERALDLIGVTPGMSVADVGAGSGYMTVRIARRVGVTGRVYAEDIQPALLSRLQDKATVEQLTNIEPVLGTEDDARLPPNTMDLVLLVDVYHEFWQPQSMLRSLRRTLKAGGRLILMEYRKEDPTIPIAATHKMSVADARTEVTAEGFTFDRVISGLPRQHIIVFRQN
ncbi:MAG: methyltransferase domain-containing protein [Vicinamibacterales bacterium]|nr:methyltransferase domain-containing protein [Vicinamibacterales bacterium]